MPDADATIMQLLRDCLFSSIRPLPGYLRLPGTRHLKYTPTEYGHVYQDGIRLLNKSTGACAAEILRRDGVSIPVWHTATGATHDLAPGILFFVGDKCDNVVSLIFASECIQLCEPKMPYFRTFTTGYHYSDPDLLQQLRAAVREYGITFDTIGEFNGADEPR